MNDLIKYGLLAFGGWLLYSRFVSTPAVAVAGGGTPASPGTPATPPVKTPSVVTTPTIPAAPSIDATAYCATAKKVSAAAGPSAAMNADNWNFLWTQASGQTQMVDLFPPGNRDAQLTFDQYLVNRQTAGVGVPIPDCTFSTHEQPGPAGMGAYQQIARNYMRRGTPMRTR